MAAGTKTVAPAEQFEALLSKITTRELYGVAVAILCEGVARAENYADAAWADGAPCEIAEEGLAFVSRFDDLWSIFGDNRAVVDAQLRLSAAEKELQAAWENTA